MMLDLSHADNQIKCVSNFNELVTTPFQGNVNAMIWQRELLGDFSEIVNVLETNESIITVSIDALHELNLSEKGQLARNILINDYNQLKAYGASPTLNIIKHYERDDFFFPTDVYSFHVDRSPISTSTFLCTYYGEPSEIIANSKTEQKILIPEIRAKLKELYDGLEDGFESFLSEHFFDLHYQAKPNSTPTNLGIGNLWRLEVDHPESKVLPCIHRAPDEKIGESRLLMIC